MNRRLVLGVACLAALVLAAGCTGLFGADPVEDDQLNENPPEGYDYEAGWNSDANAHITITDGAKFLAVYRVQDDRIELYREDGFGGQNAISVSAVRYRYPDGTVIRGSEFDEHGGSVERTNDAVVVTLPTDRPDDAPGKLAFTADSTPKQFTLPTFVEGSYEVVLPEDRKVDFFLFGRVIPDDYETTTDDRNRVHITWENVDADSIAVRFYLERDLTIFGGIAVALGLVGVGGLFYYRRKIEKLKEERRELGLDVDVDDDDFGRGPPPGMK
ncbi:DUF5803 family protein [Halegenticoccus tardaugens]|uniref:DUF5803 family protein n=1 Tax=Halegenticoccus tardaugens TaxID=2071624 RepID=UPI00100B1828|nr:DUF5803 family protein [Halegenticoccus tardaugens]